MGWKMGKVSGRKLLASSFYIIAQLVSFIYKRTITNYFLVTIRIIYLLYFIEKIICLLYLRFFLYKKVYIYIYIQCNIYKIGNPKHFKMVRRNKPVSKYFIPVNKPKRIPKRYSWHWFWTPIAISCFVHQSPTPTWILKSLNESKVF